MHYDSVMVHGRTRLTCIFVGIYYIYISLSWTVHKVDEGSLVLHVFIHKAFTFTLLYDNNMCFCCPGAWGGGVGGAVMSVV